MSGIRELRKGKHGQRLSRRVGGLIVTITNEGIELRGARRSKSVKLSYKEIAKRGLMNDGYDLTEKEWEKPLEQLWKLSELPKAK